MKKGFTLVELVIVIVIVGILSIIAVPIYRGYIEKARLTEATTALAAIRTAQMIYYTEHGTLYTVGAYVDHDDVLDIDLRGNKHFKQFQTTLDMSTAPHGLAKVRDADGIEVIHDWHVGNGPRLVHLGHTVPYFYKYEDGVATFI